jgi:hypothetical protein
MRLCKILLETVRSTSHFKDMPRYEVAVRRAVNPPGTKFKIHTRAKKDLVDDDFVSFEDWKDAWRDLRARYNPQVLNEVYDAVTFQDEFEATCARDGDGAIENPAEISHTNWEPLLAIKEVDESIAQALYADGMQSVYAVAAATLDELEAIPGSSVAKAVNMQKHAREICDFTPEPEVIDDLPPEPKKKKKRSGKGEKVLEAVAYSSDEPIDEPLSPFDIPSDS